MSQEDLGLGSQPRPGDILWRTGLVIITTKPWRSPAHDHCGHFMYAIDDTDCPKVCQTLSSQRCHDLRRVMKPAADQLQL